ncbi:hypothetical protein [Brevibacterium jeotgali]|uniref:Uncharacterized protein n=1 Tax=Brevibacterium jeotgali TaxID=1262550 RepID=A0A2H1L3S2_9MICO|nr:hypothetical protein [Brevibacterium jeotgali]TWC01803.1 hypothetical protein FB108_0457 [Brevibacterium jeotgali]SMY11548.1 hypothetical protein BJEO58_01133 [Brevibacterium jeotgali]
MARRTRTLSAEQKSVLTSVRRVARQRSRINEAYLTAIVDARQSGVTYASIADAVGTSSQAVQEIVRRHHKVEPASASRGQVSSIGDQSIGDQSGASSATTDSRASAVGATAGAIAAIAGDDDHSQPGGSGAAGSGGPGAAQATPSPAL